MDLGPWMALKGDPLTKEEISQEFKNFLWRSILNLKERCCHISTYFKVKGSLVRKSAPIRRFVLHCTLSKSVLLNATPLVQIQTTVLAKRVAAFRPLKGLGTRRHCESWRRPPPGVPRVPAHNALHHNGPYTCGVSRKFERNVPNTNLQQIIACG